MVSDQFVTAVLFVSGVVGAVAMALSILSYLRYRHSSYRRMLLPLVAVVSLLTFAHGLVLLWPEHPLLVDVLEPLAFTLLAIGVIRLVRLHPRLGRVSPWGDGQ